MTLQHLIEEILSEYAEFENSNPSPVEQRDFMRKVITRTYKQALIDARGCVGKEAIEMEGDDRENVGYNSHRTATLQNLDNLISTIETTK